jgi:hypothetical protein
MLPSTNNRHEQSSVTRTLHIPTSKKLPQLYSSRLQILYVYYKGKGKAIPVIGGEDPRGSDMSRLPHFLGNRLRWR